MNLVTHVHLQGVPERAPPPLTCAVSPAFALKRRKLGEALRPTSSEVRVAMGDIKSGPCVDAGIKTRSSGHQG